MQEEKIEIQLGEGVVAFDALRGMSYKFWTFGQIDRGDCTIFPGGTFTLYQDGSTNWRCDIKSSDSGDEWDGDFHCENQGHTHLWSDHYHFDISVENQVRRWDESRGPDSTRSNTYPEAHWLSFACSC